jgi:hypothetical protein
VHFAPGWRDWVDGQLKHGRGIELVYEPERMIECFGSVPSSHLIAEAEFLPGGERRVCKLVDGRGRIPVPRGAAEIVLWFHAVGGDGGQVWDTRFGENYRFPIG